MRLTQQQFQHIANVVLQKWKANNVLILKVDEKSVLGSAVRAIQKEYQKELDLDRDVQRKLDELERTNSGEFSRHKMYPLLKQKMAKEKKVIL